LRHLFLGKVEAQLMIFFSYRDWNPCCCSKNHNLWVKARMSQNLLCPCEMFLNTDGFYDKLNAFTRIW